MKEKEGSPRTRDILEGRREPKGKRRVTNLRALGREKHGAPTLAGREEGFTTTNRYPEKS